MMLRHSLTRSSGSGKATVRAPLWPGEVVCQIKTRETIDHFRIEEIADDYASNKEREAPEECARNNDKPADPFRHFHLPVQPVVSAAASDCGG
jgi:hypothetical protein